MAPVSRLRLPCLPCGVVGGGGRAGAGSAAVEGRAADNDKVEGTAGGGDQGEPSGRAGGAELGAEPLSGACSVLWHSHHQRGALHMASLPHGCGGCTALSYGPEPGSSRGLWRHHCPVSSRWSECRFLRRSTEAPFPCWLSAEPPELLGDDLGPGRGPGAPPPLPPHPRNL